MERANLRERHRDTHGRMVAEWNSWDAGMLPEVRASVTDAFTAEQLADHIGAKPATREPDLGTDWPAPNAGGPL